MLETINLCPALWVLSHRLDPQKATKAPLQTEELRIFGLCHNPEK